MTANGYRVSLWDEEMFWKWVEVMVARHWECINATELYVSDGYLYVM